MSRNVPVARRLFLDPVVEARAVAGGGVFSFELQEAVQRVAQRDDLAGSEQAHAVADEQARREVLSRGERRAAERFAARDAGLDPETRTDRFGEPIARQPAQRLRGGVEGIAL